jgi:hypothetical protein
MEINVVWALCFPYIVVTKIKKEECREMNRKMGVRINV